MTGAGLERRWSWRGWLGAPVMHFGLIGGLLFAGAEAWRAWGGAPEGAGWPSMGRARTTPRPPIVFSAARVGQAHADFRAQFGRDPSQEELAAAIQQAVDADVLETEARRFAFGFGDPSISWRLVQKMRAVSAEPSKPDEVLHREALELGLDDDIVIRRLLREKMRLLLAQTPGDDTVRDEDVLGYVEQHRERFVRAEAVTFSHVFLSARMHGARLREEAEAALRELRSRPGTAGASEDASDPFPLGSRLEGWPRVAVARHFGDEFAARVLALEPGGWSDPLSSPLGLHLVWVHERIPEAMPGLDGLRPGVSSAIVTQRGAERVARALEGLRSRYEVRIEWPVPTADAAASAMRP